MSETSAIVSPLLKLLQAWPGISARRNTPGGSKRKGHWVSSGTVEGTPDITGILAPHGRAFAIECKMPKTGRLSPAQQQWADEFVQLGGYYACIGTVVHGIEFIKVWQRKENEKSRLSA